MCAQEHLEDDDEGGDDDEDHEKEYVYETFENDLRKFCERWAKLEHELSSEEESDETTKTPLGIEATLATVSSGFGGNLRTQTACVGKKYKRKEMRRYVKYGGRICGNDE